MGEAREDHLLELLELRGDGGVDAWIGVAEEIHPPGADRVQVAVTREILEPNAEAAPDGNRRQLLVIFHLRARVPHVGKIPYYVGSVLLAHAWAFYHTGSGRGSSRARCSAASTRRSISRSVCRSGSVSGAQAACITLWMSSSAWRRVPLPTTVRS